ncbi:glycosyltransferase [Candidatus Pacearchaeota archaeon]|nr:glycosyltransferase [Candidatus Pacearchaeota archaeon]
MVEKNEGSSSLKDQNLCCFLSNYPPKECGIATFAKDLLFAMNKRFNPRLKSRVIALDDSTSIYNYDKNVIMQINKESIDSYIEHAKNVNNNPDIKLVCIQHEFGIFGGEYGKNLIPFLEHVEKPVVITFHSVLPDPDEERREVVKKIVAKSSAIVVMADIAVEILNRDYGIDKSKLYVIRHGIPNVPFYPSTYFKKRLNLKNRTVLSTFGLLSRGKGIEDAIESLVPLVKKYPNILYLIIGETHPAIRKNEGEVYREELIKKVESLGLQNNVKFYNKYLSLQEIIQYLLATDIYLCTNLERNQIVSGTLSYALGCGRAVVSTPIIYAEEILANNAGLLAEFKNPESFSNAIERILSDKTLRTDIERNAYQKSRSMIWSNVAARYLSTFNRVVRLREETTKKYPPVKMNHLYSLTDNLGCIQFSRDAVPDKTSGYTTDDNARAFIAATIHHNLTKSARSLKAAKIYLDFVEQAQEKNGNFKNNFQNENEVLDTYSPDSFGRTMWALGYAINKSKDKDIKIKANKLFLKALPRIKQLDAARAKAFTIIGLTHYYKKRGGSKIRILIKWLANSLLKQYKHESSADWHWFEKNLTYSNSKIPEALFRAYEITKNKKYRDVAERTLHFLSDILFVNDEMMPIGQDGWFNKDGKRALFDQQPVDVSSMVQTYLIASKITGDKHYHEKAVLAFNWFLGRNYLKQMVYNETTGGCFDGLSKDNVNLNQGAESTISYLIARLLLEEFKQKSKKRKRK